MCSTYRKQDRHTQKQKKPAGSHSVNFDGLNLTNRVYLYGIKAGDPESSSGHSFEDVKKMILMK